MRLCVHRGTSEIGGNCIEIEASGKSILSFASLSFLLSVSCCIISAATMERNGLRISPADAQSPSAPRALQTAFAWE